jgi:hypothetical protein
VDEDDRLTRAAREVAAPADPPFVQFREDPFGVRHHLGIFFV